MDNYIITAKEEVLREVGAIILGDILNYMVNHNIKSSDRSNPIAVLYKKTSKLHDSLIRNVYHSIEDLDKVLAQFNFVKEYFGEIKNG